MTDRRVEAEDYNEDTSYEEDLFGDENKEPSYLARLLGDVEEEAYDREHQVHMSIPANRVDDESALLRGDPDDPRDSPNNNGQTIN